MGVDFRVNQRPVSVDVPESTRLLWVLREHLKLTGTKYGCGVGQCGACMVHVDGQLTFSCLTPVDTVRGRSVTTIEGLSKNSTHPLQRAWLAERVPQCGYCQSGQIMSAAALLAKNPRPSRSEIVDHMSANICRCGTYQRIVRAIERAANERAERRAGAGAPSRAGDHLEDGAERRAGAQGEPQDGLGLGPQRARRAIQESPSRAGDHTKEG